MYSVKSDYWLASSLVTLSSSSDPYCLTSWWRFLWGLNILHKVKLFLWRVCHGWIPNFVNMASCKIPLDVLYPVCHQRLENTTHALWGLQNSVSHSRLLFCVARCYVNF
ncbi:hypothetical protein ACOSQ4_026676 [Xanthoceras sorbifolium]